MNAKLDISIVASAHRPGNWMNLYRSIGDNKVSFELVFVGPNPPDYGLPKNFRFIRSFVKPTQCVEIAMRNATADLVMDIADDCEFMTPQPLDKLYAIYKSCNSNKIIVSSRIMTNGKDESGFAHRFFAGDESTPLIPLCGLMSRKFYRDIGGIDKNFIAVMWSLDIAMSIYASGGKVIMSDVYINEDRSKRAGSNLCGEFWHHDRMLLESLWTDNGKVHFKRKNPVEPFSDINILTESQGPRGRWRGSFPLFIERTEDNLVRFWTVFVRASRGIKKPSMYINYAKRIALRLKGNL